MTVLNNMVVTYKASYWNINLKSNGHEINLPALIAFLHIVLKCYVISKQLYVSGTPCVLVCVIFIISEQAWNFVGQLIVVLGAHNISYSCLETVYKILYIILSSEHMPWS